MLVQKSQRHMSHTASLNFQSRVVGILLDQDTLCVEVLDIEFTITVFLIIVLPSAKNVGCNYVSPLF